MRILLLSSMLLASLLVLWVFSACKSKKDMATADSKLVSLQTSPCFGYCPSYVITIFTDGKLRFEPRMFTYEIDTLTKQISPAELTLLKKKVKEINLAQYPDRIESRVMDAAYGTLCTFGPDKCVQGSVDRPQPLLDLEEHIKALGKTHGIETYKGLNPREPRPGTGQQLIVRLNDDINAGNWLQQFGEIRLRLVQRLQMGNTWIIEYDPRQIQEDQLLDIFRSDRDVQDAQANQKANERRD